MQGKKGIPPIRVLSEDLCNKIAAGEVIERPASVVKELVENSLDAAATRILIHLTAAGRRRIEVVDNGHGMSEQDALLSIERHATSKVRKAEDLDAIGTLGFRGEALASIAAVSRIKVSSRTKGENKGKEVIIEGGLIIDQKSISMIEGTLVSVSGLFFNTPARRKFLKTASTERRRITDLITHYALMYPEIHFKLDELKNGNERRWIFKPKT